MNREDLLTQLGFNDEELLESAGMEELTLQVESPALSYEASAEISPEALKNYELLEEGSHLNVPKDFLKKVESIGDESPMFVVWEMPSGYSRFLTEEAIEGDRKPSKKNRNRFWPEEVMWGFAEQIRRRRPIGRNGHANIFSIGTIPEHIPVQWVSAVKARRKRDGLGVTLARAYVYPHGNTRDYIKTDAINSASVYTIGKGEYGTTEDSKNEDEKVWIVESAQLISFDLVPKNLHGVPGTKLVAKEAATMPKGLTAEHLALLAEITPEQLREARPDLVESFRGESSQPSEELTAITQKHSKLAVEVAKLKLPSQIATEAAEMLGCEVGEVLSELNRLKTAHDANIETALKSVIGKINGTDALKTYVREQLEAKASTFRTVEEVNTAAEQIVAAVRDAASMMFEKGEVSDNDLFKVDASMTEQGGFKSSLVKMMQGGSA